MAYKITYGENRTKLTNDVHNQRIYNMFDGNIIALTPYVNTRTKVKYKCLKHGFIWNGRPSAVMHGNTGCNECKHERRVEISSDTIDSVKQKIYDKYGDEYEVIDTEYFGHNHKMNFIHHLEDGTTHTLISFPKRILADSGCPVCSGMQIAKGFNDIATTDPEIASWFANKEETFKYSNHSNVKIDFKCPTCGHIANKSLNQVSKDRDIRCPICKDGISYPNKFIFNALLQIEDKFDVLKREYRPEWCTFIYKEKKRFGIYDIYFELNNKSYIIEMDGGFHKKYNHMNGQTIEDSQYIDKQKDLLAIENGIEIIRIDCCYIGFDDRFEYIMNNIKDSIIPLILPIDLINFDEANRRSLNSLLIDTCKLWDNGYKASEIIEKLKIPECSVSKYLKAGQKYGLCHNYSAYNSQLRTMAKQVICVNTKEIFKTIRDAEIYYSVSGIGNCCHGKTFSCGKHKETKDRLFWMFYDEYTNMTNDDILKYLNEKERFANKNRILGRKVICVSTNKVFSSAQDGATYYSIDESGIIMCCKGRINRCGKLDDGTKLIWMYYEDYIKSTTS